MTIDVREVQTQIDQIAQRIPELKNIWEEGVRVSVSDKRSIQKAVPLGSVTYEYENSSGEVEVFLCDDGKIYHSHKSSKITLANGETVSTSPHRGVHMYCSDSHDDVVASTFGVILEAIAKDLESRY